MAEIELLQVEKQEEGNMLRRQREKSKVKSVGRMS